MAGEISVLRERLDTVERLLEAKGVVDRDAIESYAPDPDAALDRALKTREYIFRVMRGVQQDLEAMTTDEPPVEEVSARLRDS